jgi:uncharacterized membrane protein YedE/YeeE
VALLYGLLVGIAMGWLLQRVRASSPAMIANALRLRNIAIIKFMALTIAVGSVVVYLLSFAVPMHFDIKPAYVLGVLVGGLIFGVGFAVGGYCPGTCVVGAGEGRKDALFAIGGGVVGALLFTALYAALEPILIKPLNFGKITLADLLHLPAIVVAVGLAAILVGAVIWLPTLPGKGSGASEDAAHE